ncbi:MAG: hypothetical protein Q8J89_11410 [Caulobacter sp.]|nr:hypothetical protein [Caulobacter sp.]
MSDDQPPPPDETPMQKALRLKKAALSAKPAAPRGGKFQRRQAAAQQTGKSKPWMAR